MRLELDYINAKTFFKILETKDFSLLSKSKKVQKEAVLKWPKLLEEYELKLGDKKQQKALRAESKIEGLKLKFSAINIACESLRFTNNNDALDILKFHRIKVDFNDYQSSISKIQNNAKSLLIQIEKLKKELPDNKDVGKSQSFDKVVLAYCAFVGVALKPVEITVSEYLGLKELFEDKIKELQKQGDGN